MPIAAFHREVAPQGSARVENGRKLPQHPSEQDAPQTSVRKNLEKIPPADSDSHKNSISRSFSLADAMKDVLHKDEALKPHTLGNDSYTLEKALSALEEFKSENKADNSIFLALSSAEAIAVEGGIELSLENKFMYQLILEYRIKIEKSLREKLNNRDLKLSISISEDSDERKQHIGPVTTLEKLKYMEEKNPQIERFIQKLFLDVE